MESLILYVAGKFKRKRSFTIDTILLIIWRLDMDAFQKTGRSITGARWFKTETGVSF